MMQKMSLYALGAQRLEALALNAIVVCWLISVQIADKFDRFDSDGRVCGVIGHLGKVVDFAEGVRRVGTRMVHQFKLSINRDIVINNHNPSSQGKVKEKA